MRHYPHLTSLPTELATRLARAMDARNLNAAQLARLADISRAALDHMLSDDAVSLPNSYSLAKLAFALDVSLDFLLGLSPRGTGDSVSFAADYHRPDDLSDWAMTDPTAAVPGGGYFVHVCTGIPDYLKSRAVLALDIPDPTLATATARDMRALRRAMADREQNGLILFDVANLNLLLDASGPYAGLTTGQVAEQIAIMADHLDRHAPTLTATVVDHRRHGLTAMFLAPPSRVILRLCDGQVSTGNSELYAHLRQSALAACKVGTPLLSHVRNRLPAARLLDCASDNAPLRMGVGAR